MLGIRAYVLARKGVLMSNPDVANMSVGQWFFEAAALREKEKFELEASHKILKNTLIGVLGLNALRPTDDFGKPKKWDEMTEKDREEFMPLIGWCGRPDMLKKVSEQLQTEKVYDEGGMDNSAYEKMVEAIDAAGGDMEPYLPTSIHTNVGTPVKDEHKNIEKPTESVSTIKVVGDV